MLGILYQQAFLTRSTPIVHQGYLPTFPTQAAVNPCSPVPNYLFWDLVHPTSQVHHILASYVYRLIQPHSINSD